MLYEVITGSFQDFHGVVVKQHHSGMKLFSDFCVRDIDTGDHLRWHWDRIVQKDLLCQGLL